MEARTGWMTDAAPLFFLLRLILDMSNFLLDSHIHLQSAWVI